MVWKRDETSLTVTYAGVTCCVTKGLSFGRRADLVLDSQNRHLHGEAGRFRRRETGWFLHNTGSTIHLHLRQERGHLVELPPASRTKLPTGEGQVRVSAGGVTYELGYHLDPTASTTEIDSRPTDTVPYGRDLTPAQVDYAVTLARHRLVGLRLPPPGQSEIARLWGVTPRTVGKTFEDIRTRLRNQGVGQIETSHDLIEHLVINRVVTINHLKAARLDDPTGPRRRRDVLRHGRQADQRDTR